MIAILAFGSLLSDPGPILQDKINIKEIRKIKTPFCVEFARYSKSRNMAPTLVPVDKGGSNVEASLLPLKEDVSLQMAYDMLYSRELNLGDCIKSYPKQRKPTKNAVIINDCGKLEGFNHVLYVNFFPAGKIEKPTPDQLADAAIRSAITSTDKRDGINYLIDAKQNGIVTPLMDKYEKIILSKTETSSLIDAYEKLNLNIKKQTLNLFNERVDRLSRSKLAKRMERPNYKLDYNKMINREWISVNGVTEDSMDAFVSNIRLLIQDKDGFSIRCLAENIYSDTTIPDKFRIEFDKHRTIWHKHISSFSLLKPFKDEQNITNGELFDILMYGGLVHANPEKVNLFLYLTKQGAISTFVCVSFLSTLRILLDVVRAIREVNLNLLRYWETKR